MAIVKPFCAIRPTRDKVSLVASRSYLSYNAETLMEKLEHNPYTFLHIINPYFSEQGEEVKGKAKYPLVKAKFHQFQKEGVFLQDETPHFYLYQQQKEAVVFTGIICASSVDDYLNGTIKIHEQTIACREEMFKDYLDSTGFNAEPALLTYPDNPTVEKIISQYLNERAEYEFTTTNRSVHTLWLIRQESDIQTLQKAFSEIDALYIADGHHRLASSALLCQQKRQENPHYKVDESYNYCMSYLIAESQLRILDFNRLVTDLNGLDKDHLLTAIRQCYSLAKAPDNFSPQRTDEIGMYLEGQWYSLTAQEGSFNRSHCVEKLDPAILSKNILSPILGIHDLRTDQRIAFMDGTLGRAALEKAVDSGEYALAFALKPIDVAQLKEVADAKESMPPKSTYIEPKLRSGLLIYSIDS